MMDAILDCQMWCDVYIILFFYSWISKHKQTKHTYQFFFFIIIFMFFFCFIFTFLNFKQTHVSTHTNPSTKKTEINYRHRLDAWWRKKSLPLRKFINSPTIKQKKMEKQNEKFISQPYKCHGAKKKRISFLFTILLKMKFKKKKIFFTIFFQF